MSTAQELLAQELSETISSYKYLEDSIRDKTFGALTVAPMLEALIAAGLEPRGLTLYKTEATLYYYEAKSFKAFEDAFTALESLGFPVEGWTSRRDSRAVIYKGVCSTKEFTLELPVNPSDELCKRVQVGTKQVEQPVYEYQCTEEAPALPPTPEKPDDDIPF